MESNMEHEDLLIKLRAKLNEEKIKLWEQPYVSTGGDLSQSFQELASRFASELSLDVNLVCSSLIELQKHSVERCKANEEFKETGCATLRVKATGKGEKRNIKVMKKLSVMGSELICTVAETLEVDTTRLKLIFNGKVIKPSPSLEEQGVKNGIQLMALIMAASPETIKEEDDMYMQMKVTLEDATLLTECFDELGEESYMNLEDQSGKAVDLPKSERKSLFIGLALHQRGRNCIKKQEYSLALVLLLEADRQFSECGAQILSAVDNYGVLQLDVAWCYLCLRSLPGAGDAAARLALAARAFRDCYGPARQKLIALKGTDANERVLFMRLYLMQGIVAYHQNRRAEAKEFLDKAERELADLRVDESSVLALMEIGWTRSQACAGLRAAAGDVNRAHHYLDERKRERDAARQKNREDKEQRALGVCADGSAVSRPLLEALQRMGFPRRLALRALRAADNCVSDAVRAIQEHPDLLEDSDLSETETPSETAQPPEPPVPPEPDSLLLAELQEMGYGSDAASSALRASGNDLALAVDILQGWSPLGEDCDGDDPSTSAGAALNRKRQKREEKRRKRRARELAIRRLRQATRSEEDDYLSSSLAEEEHFLALYKSLL